MKVAFLSTHIHWPTHYETELELMQQHHNAGDEVEHLVCNASLPICDINFQHNIPNCLQCIAKRKFGQTLLSNPVKEVELLRLKPEDRQEIDRMKKFFNTVGELQQYYIDNFDIGYAVSSSIISRLREPNPNLIAVSKQLEEYLVSALAVYRSIQNYIQDCQPDRVYVFNGRLAHVKAALRACQSKGVECIVHERGHTIQHYSLYPNTTPHDLSFIGRRIVEAWENAPQEVDKYAISDQFFQARAKGLAQSWFSFTAGQEVGKLPEQWNQARRNVVIFNSSEDEFASIGESWKNPLYKTQLDGLQQILQSTSEIAEDIHFYLRIHPNLKGIVNEETTSLYALQSSRLTIIPAESPVDTYTLLKYADKILSFGSTVGIEAVYWGRPSILAGKCYYRELGGTYNPNNHQELITFLNIHLPPKEKEPAFMYGYYMNTFGIPFQYYTGEQIKSGKFKGEYIRPVMQGWQKMTASLLVKRGLRSLNPVVSYLHSAYRKAKL